jgi:hypothetical protein
MAVSFPNYSKTNKKHQKTVQNGPNTNQKRPKLTNLYGFLQQTGGVGRRRVSASGPFAGRAGVGGSGAREAADG